MSSKPITIRVEFQLTEQEFMYWERQAYGMGIGLRSNPRARMTETERREFVRKAIHNQIAQLTPKYDER